MGELTCRKAVVIGGTLGIGLATARLLLEAGAEVVATGRDARNLETARRVLGPRARLLRTDIASVSDVDALAPIVKEKLGRVDLVLVHAGVSRLEPLGRVPGAARDGVFDAHTRGAFLAAQRLAPLVRDGGSIVFTTVTGDPAPSDRGVPSGSADALAAIAEVLGAELAPRRIRVNTAGPGFLAASSLGGSAEEIARAVLDLASGVPLPTEYERTIDALLASFGVPPEPRVGTRSGRSPQCDTMSR